MTNLTGKQIANTYKSLLTVQTSVENSGLDLNLRPIQSGDGTNSSMKLSETNAAFTGNVSVNGNLTVEGTFEPNTINTTEVQATRIVATSITTDALTADTLIFQDVSVSSLRTGNLYAVNISAGTVSATNINGTNITVNGDNVVTSAVVASVNAIFAASIAANASAIIVNASAITVLQTSVAANSSAIAVNSAAITSINSFISAGAFASVGTSATLETRIAAVSSTMATSIGNSNTNIAAVSALTKTNKDAITSINGIIGTGAFASAGTSATLETRINTVSSTMATSIGNSNTAITALSATMATSIGNSNTNIAAVSVLTKTNKDAITSINGILATGAFASVGTSATLETRINTVSATMATSIGNSNTAIATLSATMATSIGNKVSKSGDTMTGDLSFGDNIKINLGAGSDLNLYHDGSDSIIEDTGTGDLIIKASQRIYMKGVNDETLIRSTEDSQISLYHNGFEKLSTLSGGILVYGNLAAVGGTFTGNVSATGTVTANGLVVGGINYPTSDGTANQVIKTDGAGTLAFTSISGGAVDSVNGETGIVVLDAADVGALALTGGTLTGDVSFGDNDKAIFGAGSDLQIYHDGSDSYINDSGVGDLKLGGNQLQLNNAAQTANYIYAVDGAQVELKYNNLLKLTTTATGIDVTGTVTADSGSVTGEFIATSYNETYDALSGTTPTVDCHNGNMFSLTTSGNTTFTFSNPPASGTAFGFTLKLVAGGTHTITYPASVDWAGGSAPDAPASGETDVLVFITHDGGTTWYGFRAGDAMA